MKLAPRWEPADQFRGPGVPDTTLLNHTHLVSCRCIINTSDAKINILRGVLYGYPTS